jgi:hypothetical protein
VRGEGLQVLELFFGYLVLGYGMHLLLLRDHKVLRLNIQRCPIEEFFPNHALLVDGGLSVVILVVCEGTILGM